MKPKSKLWETLSTSAFSTAWFASRTTAWLIIQIGTLPYYRMFNFNTLTPILHTAKLTHDEDQFGALLRFISRWKERKLAELQFISIACAVLAGAVIGCFSWYTVPAAYWLASTFWYCSLILSIFGILTSVQQVSILGMLGELPRQVGMPAANEAVRRHLRVLLGQKHRRHERHSTAMQDKSSEIGVWEPKWTMVFTWQCAMMFMSYSVCLFILGLTVLVCTPLINRNDWTDGSTSAVVYLVVTGSGVAAFAHCSFWGFHYVDITAIEAEDMPQFQTRSTLHAKGLQPGRSSPSGRSADGELSNR